MSVAAPLMSVAAPLMSAVAPLMSAAAPLMSAAAPLMLLAAIVPAGGDNCDVCSTSTGAEVRELEDLSETPSEYRVLQEFSDSDTELRGSVLSGTGGADDKKFIFSGPFS